MRSKVSRGSREGGFLGLLRAAALIAVLAGAVGSVGLMLRAGHRNNSRILLILFALWVLSPFVALVLANMVSKGWPVLTRATLYSVTLVLTLGSLAIYGDVALGPPRAKTAFVFVVVPPASWLLIAIVVPIAALISGRLSSHRFSSKPILEAPMNVPSMKQPSAFLPVAMSLAALALVLGHAAMFGVVHEADEGAPAHIFQLLMAAQIPVVMFFAIQWLPRAPRQTLHVLAWQAGAALAAFAGVFFLT